MHDAPSTDVVGFAELDGTRALRYWCVPCAPAAACRDGEQAVWRAHAESTSARCAGCTVLLEGEEPA